MNPYFVKQFKFPGLETVEYVKCVNCGFVISKTHYELPDEDWQAINEEYHRSYQGKFENVDDPRWIERLQNQAEVIADAVKLGLVSNNSPWIDFGCGDGKLADLLLEKYGLKLGKFDRYMNNEGYLTENDLESRKFDFVITTSVIEHLIKREMLDEINDLVSDNGVMGLHLLVAEEVPDDPDWFYLLPVHCAFHTNKSMQVLFDAWGYSCSIYNVGAQLWFFFKSNSEKIEKIVNNAQKTPSREKLYYHFKRGFMDYWKLEKDKVLVRQQWRE
jgi:cyclopropane fatty-acyl-phospholipid synthase-like methyltransferase